MKDDKKLRQAFKTLSHKGPVSLPSSQRAASNAMRIVKPYLTKKEYSALLTAQCHSVDIGEGRGEWDGICKQIEKRLFGE
jgi:precorrin-2 methylase